MDLEMGWIETGGDKKTGSPGTVLVGGSRPLCDVPRQGSPWESLAVTHPERLAGREGPPSGQSWAGTSSLCGEGWQTVAPGPTGVLLRLRWAERVREQLCVSPGCQRPPERRACGLGPVGFRQANGSFFPCSRQRRMLARPACGLWAPRRGPEAKGVQGL